MPIFTDPDSTLVAAHTPIKVPTHWADQVKVGLDRDAALGIIEPVPPNTDVMVRKDGGSSFKNWISIYIIN